MVGAPFARLIANLVVMGTGVLGRAFLEAYKQALSNGGSAAASAAKKTVTRSGVAEAEARMILNVKPKATEAEVSEAAESLLKMNNPEKGGSEYLQYKIRHARDALVTPPAEEPPAPAPPKKDEGSS